MKYLMTNQNDCGPASLSAVTEMDLGTVKHLWGWDDHGDIRDDLVDSPWATLVVLEKLGLMWKYRNCSDVLYDRCLPGKTVVLIHGTGPIDSILCQHYVVYAGRSGRGNYLFHWGDGKEPRELTAQDFAGYYSRGVPAFAWELVTDGGHTKVRWYQRLWVKIMGKFA